MLINLLFDTPTELDRTTGADGSVLLRSTVRIPLTDPVLDGHYPGFPLVPGLFLLQHAHVLVTAALERAAGGPMVLEKARFLRPVRAGDSVSFKVRLDRVDGAVRATADVRVVGQPSAEIRIHYPGPGGPE
jgi:3-hydroxyacyl-[acyl-carrier-protein] dehydratase